jgi:hypothetical protein
MIPARRGKWQKFSLGKYPMLSGSRLNPLCLLNNEIQARRTNVNREAEENRYRSEEFLKP